MTSGLDTSGQSSDQLAASADANSRLQPSESDLTHVPLSYQIPRDTLEDALEARSTDTPVYWSYSMYRHPQTDKPPTLHYCKTLRDSEMVAQLFLGEKLLGFDLEWAVSGKKSAKRNVSVVQLASETRCAIFHLALHPGNSTEELLAPTLRSIIEDASIVKVGVHILGDCTRLQTNLHITPRGLLELSHLHKLVNHWENSPSSINRVSVRLSELVDTHLLLPMFKGDVRTSDWDSKLSMEQLTYAASDAYAAVQLHNVLDGKRKLLRPVPPPMPYFAELGLPINLGVKEPVRRQSTRASIETSSGDLDQEDVLVSTEMDDAEEQLQGLSEGTAKATNQPPPPELILADEWAEAFQAQVAQLDAPKRKVHSKASQLRAYALWHEQKFSIKETASLLRNPPLKPATVAMYILLAVHQDNLPFEEARMREVGSKIKFVLPFLRSSSIVGPYLLKDRQN